jgi:glyoxalase family protein
MSGPAKKLQVQGLHHITIKGADRQSTIDFWEGVLGMPFIFDQPNLDQPAEGHLYFDPGDGRLITVFTHEARKPPKRRAAVEVGSVHHLAFAVSLATFRQAVARLEARGIAHSGPKDRGFMDSIYFEDPCGLLVELACYKFHPPEGCSHAEVMIEAHRLRVAAGAAAIGEPHLADAIEALILRHRQSLSAERGARNPYGE